jgi:hypothetical protein
MLLGDIAILHVNGLPYADIAAFSNASLSDGFWDKISAILEGNKRNEREHDV